MQTNLHDLLNKEMNRKDFLKTIGFGVVALLGASTVIKTLTGISKPTAQNTPARPQTARSNGFGASDYGNKQAHLRKV